LKSAIPSIDKPSTQPYAVTIVTDKVFEMSLKRKRNYSVMCTCVICGRRFRASRTDAKYDSDACRQKASRDRGGRRKKNNPSGASQMTLAQLDALLNKQILLAIDRGVS